MAVFLVIVALSLVLFLVPKKFLYPLAFGLQALIIIFTSYLAVRAFAEPEALRIFFFRLTDNDIYLVIDRMSAFFVLTINLTLFTGILYAKGYLKSYYGSKNTSELALHYFSFVWLHLSMLLVCVLRDGLGFLVAWELMSLSSFFLVIFESEKKDIIRTGIQYLIQMHIGLAFLITAFLLAGMKSGGTIGFDGLPAYFDHYKSFGVFLLFFAGFGIKAGFIPFHTWLPHAHPAAPSHVSGVMSGVMIKMGLYGILRVLTSVHDGLLQIGVFILAVSLVSGIAGIILALVQQDIKKMLAYSSIENVGIIGTGIGLGTIGTAAGIPALAVLGYSGAFLHIFNHSLFKSMLFYASGNVYRQTHTRNMDQLGGLAKTMPATAFFFLLGATAIAGLPPLNGFISEFLLYSGMFRSLSASDFSLSLVLLGGIIGLVLIGGLTLYCFTKAFGIVFLGNARSDRPSHAREAERSMLFPLLFISLFMAAIGIFPFLIAEPLGKIVTIFVPDASLLNAALPPLSGISIVFAFLFLVIFLLFLLRSRLEKKRTVTMDSTWGCGNTAADPALNQYTARSYADYIETFTRHLAGVKKKYDPIEKDEIFPAGRTYESHNTDVFEDRLISGPTGRLMAFLEKIAVFQTGNIQHYLLYAIVFIAIVILLTLMGVMS